MSSGFERIILASFLFVVLASALVVTAVPPAAARAETATSFEWTRQWTAGDGDPVCLAVDPGAMYAACENHLRKYDAGGALLWDRDLDDVGGDDYLHQVTSISASGGAVYLAGSVWCDPETTSGDFCGGFICRYNASGDWAWTLYPESEIYATGGWGVFADASGVYLAGNSWSWDTESGSGFLRKYDASGGDLWWRDLELGTVDTCWGVCADSEGVYVSGNAPHELSDSEGGRRFLCKYGADNTWFWTREYEWAVDSAASPVCAGSGAIYVADGASGALRQYDSLGSELWARDIGEGARVLALAIDGGGVCVAGLVSGAIAGQTSQGGDDAFAGRYDAAGNQVWIRQFGSEVDDAATAVAGATALAGGSGVCLAGNTSGTLAGAEGTGHGFAALLSSNAYPERPVNVSPAGGESGVSVTPTLQGSAFADADGDSHAASRWQVRSEAGDYDSPAWDSGSAAPAASITVPDGALAHSATYYWRVGYQDGRGLWSSYSLETAFTTADMGAAAPAVVTLAAEGVGSREATLKLSLTGLGSAASAQVSFEWGQGAAYDNSTAPQTMTGIGTMSFDLSGLTPATAYHFRAKAEGNVTAYGGDLTFTTLSAEATPPAVSTGEATAVTGSSARLAGELTSPGTAGSVTAGFVWGTQQGGPYPNETAGSALAAAGSFSFDLTGLASETAFYYRARGVGDGTGYGDEKSFTTAGTGPVLGTVAADSGRQGDELTVSITGANLSGASGVDFGAGIIVEEYSVVSDGQVTARIVIGNQAESGVRTVTVTTPSGTGSIPGGFTVHGTSARVRLWVYVVGAAAGVAVVGVLATSLGLLIKRRRAR